MSVGLAMSLSSVLPVLAALTLGLLAGALLAEGFLLVPYWRTLSAETFYELHPSHGQRLFRFFAPLTVAAPLTATLAAAQAGLTNAAPLPSATGAAVLACGLVAIYGGYFKSTNESFARRAVDATQLPQVLKRWAAWHRVRTALCIAAFALALLAIAP